MQYDPYTPHKGCQEDKGGNTGQPKPVQGSPLRDPIVSFVLVDRLGCIGYWVNCAVTLFLGQDCSKSGCTSMCLQDEDLPIPNLGIQWGANGSES